MKLHETPEDFKTLIKLAAQWMNIRDVYVEKDYWVTFLLKRLTSVDNNDRIVFKGGTSLAKAYGLIKRFSEDIDLAVIKDGMTDAAVQRFIRETSKYLTTDPFKEIAELGTTSKMGLNRRTLHRYPRFTENTNFGPVRDSLLLELNCFDSPTPNVTRSISSFIADYLQSQNQNDQIEHYQLEGFSIKTLDYKRTFVEKILSLSYSSLEDESKEINEVRARIRHFYDLTILLQEVEIIKFLDSTDFPSLIKSVREEECLPSRTKWAQEKLSRAHLHSKPKALLDKIESIFKSDLEPMVFQASDLSKFKDVRAAFQKISKRIKESNL